MKMKKFTAATQTEAMSLVRAEYGDEALILSQKNIAGGYEILATHTGEAEIAGVEFKKDNFESTEGKSKLSVDIGDEDDDALAEHSYSWSKKAVDAVPQAVTPQATQRPVVNQEMLDSETEDEKAARRQAMAMELAQNEQNAQILEINRVLREELKALTEKVDRQNQLSLANTQIYRQQSKVRLWESMVGAGFSKVLINKILSKLPAGLYDDEIGAMAWVNEVLKSNLKCIHPDEDMVEKGGIYGFVGPAGSGKTTSIAKIGSRALVSKGKNSVAFITTDHYRIAAQDQLNTYGRILGIPTYTATNEKELKEQLEILSGKHLVLVDNAGFSFAENRLQEQCELLDSAKIPRVLVMNASIQAESQEHILHSFDRKSLQSAILTKIDETLKMATSIDVLIRHNLPVHYVSAGQRVPEDLKAPLADFLVNKALTFRQSMSFQFDSVEWEHLYRSQVNSI